MLAWFSGWPFLTNILPLGKAHELTSGGTIALISAATGLEVAAGFILLLHAFLQENLTAAGRNDGAAALPHRLCRGRVAVFGWSVRRGHQKIGIFCFFRSPSFRRPPTCFSTRIGYRPGLPAPVFTDGVYPGSPAVDPVIQALMLTDVVVEATVVALLLAITVRIHRRTGTADPNQVDLMRG